MIYLQRTQLLTKLPVLTVHRNTPDGATRLYVQLDWCAVSPKTQSQKCEAESLHLCMQLDYALLANAFDMTKVPVPKVWSKITMLNCEPFPSASEHN